MGNSSRLSNIIIVFSILFTTRKIHLSLIQTNQRLYVLFMISNHQTTNFVFPNFFYECFSIWVFEKENKLFIGSNPRKNLFRTNKKIVFFSTAQAKKKSWKNWGKQLIGCLVVWCHEQDINCIQFFSADAKIFRK